MKNLKLSAMVTVLVTCFISQIAFAGGEGGGGGVAVVDKNLKVRLLDLNDTPASELLSRATAEKKLLDQNISLNRLAGRDNIHFFADAENILLANAKTYRVFSYLAPILNFVYVYQTKINIGRALAASGMAPDRLSPSLPENLQNSTAYYHAGALVLSDLFYNKMGPNSHIAAEVHESLRVLNQILPVGLSTPEIEAMTRHLIGLSRAQDKTLLASASSKLQSAYKIAAKKFDLNSIRLYSAIFEQARALAVSSTSSNAQLWPYMFMPGFNHTIDAVCRGECRKVVSVLPVSEQQGFNDLISKLGFQELSDMIIWTETPVIEMSLYIENQGGNTKDSYYNPLRNEICRDHTTCVPLEKLSADD